MKASSKVIRIQVNRPFTSIEQQKYWRRVHGILTKIIGWWNAKERTVWVDFVYLPGEEVSVYITVPKIHEEKLTTQFQPRGRRRRTGSLQLINDDIDVLNIPSEMSVCELKLVCENIFALAPENPIAIPTTLPLTEGEKARISFCLQPATLGKDPHIQKLLRERIEKGRLDTRANVRVTGIFHLLLHLLDQLMHLSRRKKVEEGEGAWLTKETIKKLNDCHFTTHLRIAGPQRLLPKLARPFQLIGGENRLAIRFLPQKEQNAARRELNKQSLGLYSKSDLNPNIFACTELGIMMPFLSIQPSLQKEFDARPNFL